MADGLHSIEFLPTQNEIRKSLCPGFSLWFYKFKPRDSHRFIGLKSTKECGKLHFDCLKRLR